MDWLSQLIAYVVSMTVVELCKNMPAIKEAWLAADRTTATVAPPLPEQRAVQKEIADAIQTGQAPGAAAVH